MCLLICLCGLKRVDGVLRSAWILLKGSLRVVWGQCIQSESALQSGMHPVLMFDVCVSVLTQDS